MFGGEGHKTSDSLGGLLKTWLFSGLKTSSGPEPLEKTCVRERLKTQTSMAHDCKISVANVFLKQMHRFSRPPMSQPLWHRQADEDVV